MLYKELLAARPQLMSVVVIGVVLFVGDLIGTDSLGGIAGLLTQGTDGLLILTGALAFAVGHGQIGPEVTHDHVDLLDGLPVTRGEVYAAKLSVGAMIVALLVALTAAVKMGLAELTWGGAGDDTLLTVLGAHAVGLAAFYSSGLLLSWLGGFGWAVLGVGFTVLTTFAEVVPTLRPLSIFYGYGTVRFEANQPVIVLWPLWFWGGYAVACVMSSGLLFVGRGDRLVEAGSGLARFAKVGLMTVLGGVLVVAATLTSFRLAARTTEAASAPEFAKAGTFRVLVPANAPSAAQALLLAIPTIDDQVRTLLGVDAPLRLDVELAGRGRFHAGLYTGGKIRMAVTENAGSVFAHELVHAYADAIADGAFRRHHDALRFFNEGLAMWAADQVVATPAEIEAHRAWAGALFTLDQHHVDLLMHDSARAARFDPFEPYPLGLTFVEGLHQAAGVEAIRCLLRQAGQLPDRELDGTAVWNRLVTGCGIDFDRVVDAYEARLQSYAERYPMPDEDTLAAPVWADGRLQLVLPPRSDGAPPLTVAPRDRRRCRFRSRIAAPPADLDESTVGAGHLCPVHSIIGATETVSYQVGVRLDGGWTVYGPWIQQPVPPEPDAGSPAGPPLGASR